MKKKPLSQQKIGFPHMAKIPTYSLSSYFPITWRKFSTCAIELIPNNIKGIGVGRIVILEYRKEGFWGTSQRLAPCCGICGHKLKTCAMLGSQL
jgi:hypothetical protein